jgi:hypothetical protein
MVKRRTGKGIDFPTTVQGFKRSEKYILESQLTPYDYVSPDARAVGLFRAEDAVYLCKDITKLKSANTWRHTHMRAIKHGESPRRVIRRNVGGLQRAIELFDLNQTEPLEILKASRESGIPVNEYGNVEADRIPDNAVLITVNDIDFASRICRKFKDLVWCRCQDGWRRTKPHYSGIVVLKEDADRIRESIRAAIQDSVDKERKEEDQIALAIWRVLLQRIKAEYYIQKNIDRN